MIASSVSANENISELIAGFHEDCVLRDMVSVMDYLYRAKDYCSFLEARGKTPLTADQEDLTSFLVNLKMKGLKFGTIKRIFTCLGAFYEFLIIKRKVLYNPILPFRKHYLRQYKNGNDSEIRKLIDVEEASKLVNSVLDSRDKCILVLLLKTGMRLGELTSLDVRDVDLSKGEVTLKHKKKRSNRILYLDNEAIVVLQRWLAVRKNRKGSNEQALFISKTGARVTAKVAERLTERHAERVGLHDPRSNRLEDRFTPHCCRHWFTTHLRRAGMPREFIQELRGDVRKEAIDIYDHIDKKELRESYLAHIPQLGI